MPDEGLQAARIKLEGELPERQDRIVRSGWYWRPHQGEQTSNPYAVSLGRAKRLGKAVRAISVSIAVNRDLGKAPCKVQVVMM